ncbi:MULTISPECIES: hypothetical protein [Elizabethkingia]|uniref:Uncharacterized protein n=2 Tax=Elizabethkingia anophelis TaxID=1117645 RepID=A0A077ECY3_9FLAO|nr:hypothetical protein [Elizabethkingia anophelis]AIL45352.1 hypothetical protein BD94_1577 [Elizabethkingia anophelis NUHP1]MDV4115285.1 hypothetical protein [Elizabethkingia anophelis]
MKTLDYAQMEYLQGGKKVGWRNCFESGAGQAPMIIGAIIAGFWGPAGTAAFYAGGALACIGE